MALERMGSTVTKLTAKIATYSKELLAPIEAQERDVLKAIDDSYTRIQNAHAVVTGHLASVRKVTQAQEDLLDATGLKGTREKVIDTAAEVSDKIAELTSKAQAGQDKVESFAQKLCELVTRARAVAANKKMTEAEVSETCTDKLAGQ
jgi:hypothetical protein